MDSDFPDREPRRSRIAVIANGAGEDVVAGVVQHRDSWRKLTTKPTGAIELGQVPRIVGAVSR